MINQKIKQEDRLTLSTNDSSNPLADNTNPAVYKITELAHDECHADHTINEVTDVHTSMISDSKRQKDSENYKRLKTNPISHFQSQTTSDEDRGLIIQSNIQNINNMLKQPNVYASSILASGNQYERRQLNRRVSQQRRKRKSTNRTDRSKKQKIRKLNNYYQKKKRDSMQPNRQQLKGRPQRSTTRNNNLREWQSDIDALPPHEQQQYYQITRQQSRHLAQRAKSAYLSNKNIIDLTDNE